MLAQVVYPGDMDGILLPKSSTDGARLKAPGRPTAVTKVAICRLAGRGLPVEPGAPGAPSHSHAELLPLVVRFGTRVPFFNVSPEIQGPVRDAGPGTGAVRPPNRHGWRESCRRPTSAARSFLPPARRSCLAKRPAVRSSTTSRPTGCLRGSRQHGKKGIESRATSVYSIAVIHRSEQVASQVFRVCRARR